MDISFLVIGVDVRISWFYFVISIALQYVLSASNTFCSFVAASNTQSKLSIGNLFSFTV